MFKLDEKLKNDSFAIGNLELCQILLMNNAYYPWLILVPQRKNIVEIIDLTAQDRILLMEEISFISEITKNIYHPLKLNIATLGNIVRQMHIHIIARNENDNAWPNPVWGTASKAYNNDGKEDNLNKLTAALSKFAQFQIKEN